MKKDIKVKDKWNLALLYTSENDKNIVSDLDRMESAVNSFSKKYNSSDIDFTSSPQNLRIALIDYEKLVDENITMKPYLYFMYRSHLNANDSVATSQITILESRYAKITNSLNFFTLKIGKIPSEMRATYLNHPELVKYKYFIEKIFRESEHYLSEVEEKILNLKSQTGYSMWVESFERVINNEKLKWKNKIIPLSEARTIISEQKPKDREKLWKLINEIYIKNADFATSELNAIVTDKKINDELRKYPKPYSSTINRYENEEKTVEQIQKVVTESFNISNKFYKLKTKLLKQKKINYWDTNVSLGKINKKFNYNDTLNLIIKSFSQLNPKYGEIVSNYAKNGQIDVYPKTGKRGGAYSSSSLRTPGFVLLNHVNNIDSVLVFAHEMGHAIHSVISEENQPALYADYSIATAEVASTFFENLASDEILKFLNKKEQIILLENRIRDAINSIQRQIACFNFEVELHNNIRERGHLNKEEIAKLMNKNMEAYIGGSLNKIPNAGYLFVAWPHIRNYFYVYSYAFGRLVSDALYSSYLSDNQYKEKIHLFLSAGCSKSPENIFLDIGIKIADEKFLKQGLDRIDKMIDQLSELVEK